MSTVTTPVESLRSLITYVVDKHHAYLRNELPFLEERVAKMATNHGQERPELFKVQQVLQDLRDDLTAHLMKEEQVLFPYITELEGSAESGGERPAACFPSVRFPIRMMMTEHDTAEGFLQSLRGLTNNYTAPEGLCGCGQEFYKRLSALESDLHEHIRLENETLFPRAVELEEMGQ